MTTATTATQVHDHSHHAGSICHDENDDGCCDDCGVSLAECDDCGGIGYHAAGCGDERGHDAECPACRGALSDENCAEAAAREKAAWSKANEAWCRAEQDVTCHAVSS